MYYQWNYFESGITGWTQITTPYIPNPNAVPIDTSTISTRIVEDLADGSEGFITPETKYKYEPVQFTWQFQSGATVGDKFKQLCRDDIKFKIQPHMPDKTWVGKIDRVDEKLILHNVADYRDIIVTLKPMLDES